MNTKKLVVLTGLALVLFCGLMASCGRKEPAQNGVKVIPQKIGQEISPVLLKALQEDEKESAPRAEARKKAYEADRARFEPTARALAEAVKSAGVDLDSYLAASKQFVETPPEQTSQAAADAVNGQFAEPIRSAIAKAVTVPGVGDLLQQGHSEQGVSVQFGQEQRPGANLPTPGGPGPQPTGGGGTSPCCSSARFEPPFEGLSSEGDLGARSIRPGPTEQLYPTVRSAIAFAPHRRETSGRVITVPADTRYVSVTVNLGTSWVIGLSGVGYAHVWLGLDMTVRDSGGAVVCSAPHMEQDNQWTWAGGFLTLSDHRPGPDVTLTCEFGRAPGGPTDYSANVSASADGTFVGFSGGYGDYSVKLGPVDVRTCP